MSVKKNIYIMYIISFLQGLVFYAPIATLYRQARGVSIFQITIIESISLILCLVLEIPWGIIADRIGYKNTMIFCCCLYLLSKLIFWKAWDFSGFLAERILLSIVISGISGVDTSILYLSSPKGKSQKIFGITNSLSMSGLLSASLIFSFFVGDNFDLAGELTVMSYALAAIASFFLTEVKHTQKRDFDFHEFKNILASVFRNRYLLFFLISVSLISEAHQTITVFLNQLQYERAGLSSSSIGLIYIIATISGLTGVFSMSMTQKFGVRKSGSLLFIISVLSCSVLAFTSDKFLSILSILLIQISFSLFQPLQTQYQNMQVVTENRATALSVNAMITDSIGACTNLAFGSLAKSNLSYAFIFGAIICTAGLILFLIWSSRQKQITGNIKSYDEIILEKHE
jgi:predicted MFS family arabinose efflux permease